MRNLIICLLVLVGLVGCELESGGGWTLREHKLDISDQDNACSYEVSYPLPKGYWNEEHYFVENGHYIEIYVNNTDFEECKISIFIDKEWRGDIRCVNNVLIDEYYDNISVDFEVEITTGN